MVEMKSKDRVIAVMQLREPDRVPVQVLATPWCYLQLFGRGNFYDCGSDPEKLAKAAVWGCKEVGFDGANILTDTQMTWEAIAEASGYQYVSTKWADFEPQHPHRLYEGDPLKEVAYGDPLIKTMKDAERLVPADPYKHGRLPVFIEAIKIMKRELKEDWTIGGVYENPVAPGGSLMGWTQMFMAMENNVELWEKVKSVIVETSYAFAKAQLEAGADSLFTVSNMPNWVGSDLFLSKPVWIHADHPPDLMERIYKDFGVGTGIHPCSVGPFLPGIKAWKLWLEHTPAFAMPETGGADELAIAKEELKPAVMIGNVPPIDVLLHGTPSDVEACCLELIQKVAPGGRYMMGAGCEVPSFTPPQNVETMVSTCKEYGKYPIKL